MVQHAYNTNIWESKVEDCEFEASWSYVVSFMLSLGYSVKLHLRKQNKKQNTTNRDP